MMMTLSYLPITKPRKNAAIIPTRITHDLCMRWVQSAASSKAQKNVSSRQSERLPRPRQQASAGNCVRQKKHRRRRVSVVPSVEEPGCPPTNDAMEGGVRHCLNCFRPMQCRNRCAALTMVGTNSLRWQVGGSRIPSSPRVGPVNFRFLFFFLENPRAVRIPTSFARACRP